MEFPRLLYRGAPESAEYCTVDTEDALAIKLDEGWRLRRRDVVSVVEPTVLDPEPAVEVPEPVPVKRGPGRPRKVR